MATTPEKGQRLPDVEFLTEAGTKLPTGELTGSKTVLYFYPKETTPPAAPRRPAPSATA